MALANKDRQAAFKQKMRDTGMRQVSIWVDPCQEQAVKALLAGTQPANEAETERLASWADKLAAEERQLDARWNELDALVTETNQRRENLTKLQLVLHDREKHFDRIDAAQAATQAALDQREKALAQREVGEGFANPVESRLSRQQRADHLVEWFTTSKDWQTGEKVAVKGGYAALQNAAEMTSLSRQTKAARTAIGSLLAAYAEKHALLNAREINTLKEVLHVLGNLGAAAGDAKDRVNSSAKKIAEDEKAREAAAERSANTMYPSIPMVDAILLLCHLHGHANDYVLRELRMARLEQLNAKSFRQDVGYMENEAVTEFRYRIRSTMTTASGASPQVAADEAAGAIRAEFEAARAGLMAKYAKLIEHATTCMTAAMLEQSN